MTGWGNVVSAVISKVLPTFGKTHGYFAIAAILLNKPPRAQYDIPRTGASLAK